MWEFLPSSRVLETARRNRPVVRFPSELYRQVYLRLIWHRFPLYPAGHLHWNVLLRFLHSPPFTQGEDAHGRTKNF